MTQRGLYSQSRSSFFYSIKSPHTGFCNLVNNYKNAITKKNFILLSSWNWTLSLSFPKSYLRGIIQRKKMYCHIFKNIHSTIKNQAYYVWILYFWNKLIKNMIFLTIDFYYKINLFPRVSIVLIFFIKYPSHTHTHTHESA